MVGQDDDVANGIDDDDEGNPVDGIADYGLGQTGVGVADGNESNGIYDIYWNVAVNQPINNVKTIRVIVLWPDRGTVKRASVTSMKMDVI